MHNQDLPAAATPPSPRRPRKGIGAASSMGLVLFAILALAGLAGAGVALATYVRLAADLPDPTQLERIELPQQSVVYDRTGTVELARFGDFNRRVVTFDEIPPVLIDATTAVEDRTFWENAGFDPVGIVAAGLDALRGNARGGSTITQQLVRQRLLTTNGEAQTQVTASRKLREIIQSIRVTQAYQGVEGKQRIITAYLNQNYYGNDAYGVAAAAQAYFGVGLQDLTLAQAAILAAIPQAPSTYDLVQNAVEQCIDPSQPEDTCDTQLVVPPDAPIVVRRNHVLDLMEQNGTPLTDGQFTATDFEAARNAPVVLAPQRSAQWKEPQFVYQVRRELTTRLCGADAETCPVLERGGLRITSTLDLDLQAVATKWVKAAAVVPNAKNPRAAARAIGIDYQSWMANIRKGDLHNGALVAMDYQTGELVAYVGSADPTATKATKKFQPRFDVLADGWRQPGSAFKPIMYVTGINDRSVTAASMFMDVVTDFGGGYTPTDADGMERGPVRLRNALQFSLNIPAVKAGAVIGNDNIETTAEAMGLQFQNGQVSAGMSIALGVEVVHPLDLTGAYGVLGDGGQKVEQTTIITVSDPSGAVILSEQDLPAPTRVLDPGSAAIMTDILAGNTDPGVNPYWGRFEIKDGNKRRPAALKTGTNNEARDLSAYGYIAAPTAKGRDRGEYALAVGVWNGNSNNSAVGLTSLEVPTYVWQGFLTEATKGWAIRSFRVPDTLRRVAVDPWTGLATTGSPSVNELFLPGTTPAAAEAPGSVCGSAVLSVAGFESQHASWMAADEGWIKRADKGPGVRGGPKRTPTSYFYNGAFIPYGKSWGAIAGGGGCASPSPSPSASFDPCASLPPGASLDPSASPVICPSPSTTPSESAAPTETPTPTLAPPTPTATPTRPPPTPTPTPPPATATPTPAPTPTPTPTPPPATATPATQPG